MMVYRTKYGWKAAVKFSFVYLLICSIWIISSDKVVYWMEQHLFYCSMPQLQTYKGLGFVFATSIFLFVLKLKHDSHSTQHVANYSVLVEELTAARQQLMKDISIQTEQLEIIEQRNKQLNDIAWTQSHIIRAPVARILGLVNLMRHDTDRGKIDPKVMEMFKHSADELNEVLQCIVTQTNYTK